MSLNDLDLNLEALCSRNVFVFKEYLMMLIATKYNDYITTNCEQIKDSIVCNIFPK